MLQQLKSEICCARSDTDYDLDGAANERADAKSMTRDAQEEHDAITLPARRVPVAYDADVVVVGAGPGGFAAALQAARMGARVVLVERFDMPGGVHTSGLQGSAGPGVGGIHTELMERFAAEGYIYTATQATLPDWAGNPLSHYERYLKPDASFTRQSFNPEGAGSVMAGMLQQAGVIALYGTSFVDAVVEPGSGNDSITAIIVENASGRQAITGKVFVEGSGTAQLAACAGVPFVSGGGAQPATAEWDGRNRPIPGGLLWITSGIDFARVVAHQKSANDPTLSKLIAEADAAGDIPPGLYRPRMKGTGVYGDLYIGHPTIDMSPMQADGSFILWQNVPYEWGLRMDESAQDDARAKRELRGFIDAEVKFLKKYVPGFETRGAEQYRPLRRHPRRPASHRRACLLPGRRPRRPAIQGRGHQADDQALPLGSASQARIRGAVFLLPAEKDQQPAADRRVAVVHL